MKKITILNLILILLLPILLLDGCQKQEKPEEEKVDTSNGPVVTEDTETDEEKILRMIQNCISDYNDNRIPEMEEYMNTELPKLPIEITSLPEINSLDELETREDSHLLTNASYVGYYTVNDRYRVVFKVYYPSGGYFWPNGELIFEVDPNNIEQNNPAFSQYKTILDDLLTKEANILDWMYGVGVNLDYSDIQEDKYYRVIDFNGTPISSNAELKGYAESVFDKKYLEENYYKSCFEGSNPTFKEFNGNLYCLETEVTSSTKNNYDTSRIIAVKEEGDITIINLLTTIMYQPQPEIKRIEIQHVEDKYLLLKAV